MPTALLAVADGDAEIDASSLDDPNLLERKHQDAVATCSEYYDWVAAVNNQPRPACPGCEARELAGRDLVAEATLTLITSRLQKRRNEQREELPL